MSILPRSFYDRDTVVVAQDLLGKRLQRVYEGTILSGIIIETEAYLPFDDPASHNIHGRTDRTIVLYGIPGITYVHSIHTYFCMDIVTEAVDRPGSVLVRAISPVSGVDCMRQLRKTNEISNLCSGPGKLCQALHITRSENGVDATDTDSVITIWDDALAIHSYETSPRIGISRGQDLLLRFRCSIL